MVYIFLLVLIYCLEREKLLILFYVGQYLHRWLDQSISVLLTLFVWFLGWVS